MKFVLAYTFFAFVATAANIAAQDISLRVYGGDFGIFLSVMAGTGVGLVIKYILDKHYIFRFQTRNAIHDGKLFAQYTLMGLLTTFIFWGFELAFHLAFKAKEMRYLGAIIGLAIGYFIKYQLDKRYVFRVEGS
jgi:putative flippase GtrA